MASGRKDLASNSLRSPYRFRSTKAFHTWQKREKGEDTHKALPSSVMFPHPHARHFPSFTSIPQRFTREKGFGQIVLSKPKYRVGGVIVRKEAGAQLLHFLEHGLKQHNNMPTTIRFGCRLPKRRRMYVVPNLGVRLITTTFHLRISHDKH
ncbi:hypothetical protein MPH_02388 [Macrophomina phaseolina MS6]|uniref:Uncharacterized protein n=1 Tax=Macrophomina phaseolina (strain MS6) TaxID=1126212 RepID=K2RCK7_MACPH|nr:hypothetical protein MPH_02388 [Macrophomina phaseolina MS6]